METIIETDDLLRLIQDDSELMAFMSNWNGKLGSLYLEYLPEFEQFLFNLPQDITTGRLKAALSAKPVKFRLLFAYRLGQFLERIQAGYKIPVYKNLWDIILYELYENQPDKINYSQQ